MRPLIRNILVDFVAGTKLLHIELIRYKVVFQVRLINLKPLLKRFALNRRVFLSGALCLSLALLAGCGGGGGGGGSSSSGFSYNPNISPPTRLRYYQDGDIWRYNVTATGAVNGTGTRTISLQREFFGPYQELAYLETDTTTIGGQTETSTVYMQQHPEYAWWDFYATADKKVYPTPIISLPGTWRKDMSYDNVPVGSATLRQKVVGSEQIKFSNRFYDTWILNRTFTDSNSQTSGTYWYDPSIGGFVKAHYTKKILTGPNAGQSTTYDAVLTSFGA